MGDPTPPDPPIIPEPTKWYCASMSAYGDWMSTCDTDPVTIKCCLLGQTIAAWESHQCLMFQELCPYTAYGSQYIQSIAGPYNSYALCYAAC